MTATASIGSHLTESSPLSGPVTGSERIEALDVLRGFALLGIFVMNVQAFAMPEVAYTNPHSWGDLSGVNYLVYAVSHLLFDQRMMAIFSMLFGAGIVMMTTRRSENGHGPAGLHYRRMFFLLLFGIAHAYLIWWGDILFVYAVCGMLVYPMRNLPPLTLIVAGVGVLAIGSLMVLSTIMVSAADPEVGAGVEQQFQRTAEQLDWEVATYRGSWLDQMEHRVPMSLWMQGPVMMFWGLWRPSGMMLLGMALYKVGVLTARASRGTFMLMLGSAVLLGLPLAIFGMRWSEGQDNVVVRVMGGMQFTYWASALVCLGWIAAVMLICRSQAMPGLRRRLAAVGRMAFTNYLMQSVLASLIFYGHGLGLFGSVERWGQAIVVLLVWAAQLAWSPWWLARYRFGPAEWLWRTLSYGRRQRMRREAAIQF